jgi:hypothetical protein
MQMKARLGGSVRVIVSGGAPLAPHVEEFLKVTMCAPVVQGYGLTESCAGSFIAVPDKISHAATVGPPLPHTEFCLESVPEMKYDALAKPARGELMIRGPSLFSGYYKMQDKTVRLPDVELVVCVVANLINLALLPAVTHGCHPSEQPTIRVLQSTSSTTVFVVLVLLTLLIVACARKCTLSISYKRCELG